MDNLSRCLTGPVVDVIAGAEKESMIVHANILLVCNSPSLQTLVSGDWKESQERVIDWSEVDAATVKRFLTFLYTGDYVVPEPEPIQKDIASNMQTLAKEESARPEQHIETDAILVPDTILGFATHLVLESAPITLSTEAEGQLPHAEAGLVQNATIETLEPRPLTPVSRCIDVGLPAKRIRTAAGRLEECSFRSNSHLYGATLLAHAQVYTFAQYHLVSQLQTFALQRLMQVLMYLDCTQPHAVSEILPVIEHVYSNTVELESREEPLRKLLSQFVAIHYTDLMTGDFEELFGKGGDFTLDVGRKVARRLIVSEGSTKLLKEEFADLEKQIRDFKLIVEDRDSRLRELTQELTEWESRERRTTKRGGYY